MPVRRLTPEELYKQGLIKKEYQDQEEQRYQNSLALQRQKAAAVTTNASANMQNVLQAKDIADIRANAQLGSATIGADGLIANRKLVNKNNIALQGLMQSREHNRAAYNLLNTALRSGNISTKNGLNSLTDTFNSPDAYINTDVLNLPTAHKSYKLIPQKDRINLQGLPVGIQQPMGAFDTTSGQFTPFDPNWRTASAPTTNPGTTQSQEPSAQSRVSPEVQQVLDQVKNFSDADIMRAKILRDQQISKNYKGLTTDQLRYLSGLR